MTHLEEVGEAVKSDKLFSGKGDVSQHSRPETSRDGKLCRGAERQFLGTKVKEVELTAPTALSFSLW